MSTYDIYCIFMISLSMFIGMGLCSLVTVFIVTRKSFLRWSFRKGMELGKEMAQELEEPAE